MDSNWRAVAELRAEAALRTRPYGQRGVLRTREGPDDGAARGVRLGYTRRLFTKFRLRVPTAMEINPILNSIKDLSERSQTIRGYL